MVQYQPARLDAAFAALSDATRRGVLEQLGHDNASITALAERFRMTRLALNGLADRLLSIGDADFPMNKLFGHLGQTE